MLSNCKISDIIDLPNIHEIFLCSYDISNIPVSLIDPNGDIIFKVGSQEVCDKYHFAHEKTKRYCLETMQGIISAGSYDISTYKCHYKLSRILAPILIKEKIFGWLIIGKFFYLDEPVDFNYYEEIAETCNFDKEDYFSSIRSIPVYDANVINKISLLYAKIAKTISELALSNIEKLKLIREKDNLISAISKSEQKYMNLYKEMENKNREVQALIDISKSIFERFDYKYTAEVIFSLCKEVIGNDMAFLSLLSDYGKVHEIIRIDTGRQKCSIKYNLVEIHGLREYAYNTRSVIVDNNYKNSPHYNYIPEGHPKIENLLIAPMLIANEPFGMLALANKEGGFTNNDMVLASNIADIAGFAIFQIKQYEELIISEAKYKGLVDSASDAIFTINSACEIVLWNKGAEEIFGYSEREAMLQNVDIIIPERFRDAFKEHINGLLKNGCANFTGYKAEVIGLTKDKREIPIDLRMSVTKLKNEIHFTYIQRDISDRKIIERDLKIAKEIAESANKAKSEFLSTVTHELRTPLNVMLGFIDIINDTKLDEKQQYYLDCIKLSANLLLNLINDILDISKMEKGKLELNCTTINVRVFVEKIYKMFEIIVKQKGIDFAYNIESDVPEFLYADEARIRQIIINLLGNALKFTDSGLIYFSITRDKSYKPQDNKKVKLLFLVQDTGIGIPSDKIDYIFEEFTQIDRINTNKFQGSGLGLPICKRLVKLMKGEIWVDSILGKGSAFYFTIEVDIADDTKIIDDRKVIDYQKLDLSKLNNKKILIAEDNSLNQFIIKKILINAGIDVTIASNGQEAIKILSEREFDMVLMDIQMPIMDGVEATKIIRDTSSDVINHNIPIIAFTAHALEHEKDEFLKIGMNDYIFKPIDSKSLIYKIYKLLV